MIRGFTWGNITCLWCGCFARTEKNELFFYWRNVHKGQGERAPSIRRLLMSWGCVNLQRALIGRLLGLWAEWRGTLVPKG